MRPQAPGPRRRITPGAANVHSITECDAQLRRIVHQFAAFDRWEIARAADIWLDERLRAMALS